MAIDTCTLNVLSIQNVLPLGVSILKPVVITVLVVINEVTFGSLLSENLKYWVIQNSENRLGHHYQ
jgi:hypothetical protein